MKTQYVLFGSILLFALGCEKNTDFDSIASTNIKNTTTQQMKSAEQIDMTMIVPDGSKVEVQKVLFDEVKKNSAVPVIVMTNIKDDYFNSKDAPNTIAAKERYFQEVKQSIQKSMAGKITRDLQIINAFAATIDEKDLNNLLSDNNVSKIFLDMPVHSTLDLATQTIHATDLWSVTTPMAVSIDGAGVKIAVIDTGIDYTHPDLGGCLGANCKVIGGYDFVNNDADPMDDNFHGTHCAAVAAGNGVYPGVAPGAKLLAYKVLGQDGYGTWSKTIAAIQRAIVDHADIISMSLGGGGNPNDPPSLAVNAATNQGIVSVVAAGNDGPSSSTIGSPGTAATAITVAAACRSDGMDIDGNCLFGQIIADFSSRGPLIYSGTNYNKPDISAPGVDICAARSLHTTVPYLHSCIDEQHIRISGTSMATPQVAGAAALLKQAQPAYNPAQIKQTLRNTATSMGTNVNAEGAGLLNIQSAILNAGFQPNATVTPSYWEVKSAPPNTDKSAPTKNYRHPFTITGGLVNSGIVTADLYPAINGVTLTMNPISQPITSSPTTFNLKLSVNHFVAANGIYARKIRLMNGSGQLVATIHLNLEIRPILLLEKPLADGSANNGSPGNIDLFYGFWLGSTPFNYSISSFTIRRRPLDSMTFTDIYTSNVDNGGYYQDTNVLTEGELVYQIKINYRDGTSNYEGLYNTVVAKLGQPRNFSVVPVLTEQKFTWNPPTNGAAYIGGYIMQYSSNNAAPVQWPSGGLTGTQYQDYPPGCGWLQQVKYRIQTVSNDPNVANSNFTPWVNTTCP